jgi:eukaryotic-like serine/threonine-protein kinase
MTTYTAVHLALAGVCMLVGLFFLAVHRVVRSDRAVLWIGLSFLLFALCDVGLAATSSAAKHGLGPPDRWWFLVAVTVTLACPTIMLAAWAVMDLHVQGWRRFVPWLMLAGGGILGVELMLGAIAGTAPGTFEEVLNRTDRPAPIIWWSCALLVSTISLFDGLRVLRHRRGTAVAVVLVASVSGVLFVREISIGRELVAGPSLVSLVTIPFLLCAALITAVRVVHRLRGQGEIGRYRIVSPIGRGGMGEMFLAARTGPAGFHREVALKRMRGDVANPDALARFLREARVAAKLNHPNIVGVHDLGILEGGWYIAMDYVPGVSAAQLLSRAQQAREVLAVPLVLTIGVAVCRGLAYAHDQGVVHRDVSADNIMIAFTGDVKIIDFGIAAINESVPAPAPHHGPADVTQAGTFIGKTAYAAPERLFGSPASPQSDLFSLGVVLYELLAGRRPFEGASAEDVSFHIAHSEYPPLRERRGDVPAALEVIIERALARRPETRIGSAHELAGQLQRVMAPATSAELAAVAQKLFASEWLAECEVPGSGMARVLAAQNADAPVTAATAATAAATVR